MTRARPSRPQPGSSLVLAPTALAAALAVAYLAWAPPSTDLAAATFRAELFEREGFETYNELWYGGHNLLSYSVLYPPLAALLGVRETGAIAVVAAAAVFAIIARARLGERAQIPALWFAGGVTAWLWTGRMPFLLGVALGLGALLAGERGRTALAVTLAALCAFASPVAGLFLALAGVAIGLAGERRDGARLALGAAVPILVLNLAYPVGGEQPYAIASLIAVPALALAVLWLVPDRDRALRIGAVLYAGLALAAFVIPSALGGNVNRLGALFAGPVLALALWQRGRWVVLAVSLPLLYWQLVGPVRDVAKAVDDPSTERAFHQPLLDELDRLADVDRVHVPPTRNRWEAVYVALEHPIARGWLRQLESEDFDLFTDGNLTPRAYRGWLEEHGVGYVAVPDAERDWLADDEVELIGSGLGYLEPVWSNPDWRLYRVAGG